MATTEDPRGAETDTDEREDPGPVVSAHRATPDRTVFTEEGNTDGWIASDLAVDPEP